MQRLLTSLVLLLALGLGMDAATALGLGRVGTAAVLGQPLNFTIGLRLDASEPIESRCVKAEVSFGDRALPDEAVRARVETASATGERRIRVTTTAVVDEPVVSVHLRLGCPLSLSRDFTLLADPPGAMGAAGAAGQEGWMPERADMQTSSILSAVPPTAGASTPDGQATDARRPRGNRGAMRAPLRGGVRGGVRGDLPQEVPVARVPGTRAGSAAPAPRGPVLRLDPVEADALILPQLQMETRLSLPPEGAASGGIARALDPETAQRREELARLKAMEQSLLKLRADSQANQKSLDQMQQRVRAAEAARYANPLVYLLVFLCLVLAAGLGAMWWLRRRDRATSAWWAERPVDAPAHAEAPSPAAAPVPPDAGPSLSGVASAPQPLPTIAHALDLSPPPAPLPMVAATARTAESDAVVEPRRPMSAEELIDLEQQAEFFVVLGQDEAAIDLLMGHVRSTGGVSPLPYLKLLEIYRRRGEREPYDRIRERFNRRFNAYAPEWDVDPEQGLSLDGYPEVMQRLQDVWNRPSQAMELLDTALFRRDAGPTFDVPAYRELLFLYSTARDLAERDLGPGGVDLLLPFGDEGAPPMMTSVAASPFSAPASAPLALSPSVPPPEHPSASFSLDLDVSTDQPPLTLEDIDFKDEFKKKTDR